MTAVLPDSVKEAMGEQIPLKRFGRTEDVADMAAYLASDKAGYITGQVICVGRRNGDVRQSCDKAEV